MEVWAARVPLKARPHRQRLLSQKNSLQTALRFSARSQLERLVAALAAQLAKAAAQLVAPAPQPQLPFHHKVASRFLLCRWASQPLVPGVAAQPPFHHEVASRFLLCRWVSQPLVPGVAAQPPFHHEFASRFLLCRWVSLCLARNHNSMHRQTPAERASPTPQDRRGDLSGSSSRHARYYLDTRRSLLPSPRQGHRVSIHLK